MRRRVLLAATVSLLAASTLAARAADRAWVTVYAQEAFPKQTRTNQQIDAINQTFGTDFEDWSDVHNLSLGVKVFRPVTPAWLVGLEWDYSQGGIDGRAEVPTIAGPAEVAFEQKYSVFTDLMLVTHFLPCSGCQRAVPFFLGGAGVGYESDRTTLSVRNEYLDESLRVDNSGWFPTATAGLGVDLPFGARRDWYVEIGVAYFWGRLQHQVDAQGSLAPTPQVTADNDTTGPNYWLGVGRRF